MNDDTRDALLMAVAEALLAGEIVGRDMIGSTVISEIRRSYVGKETEDQLRALLARARHERERPEDRG